MGDRPVPLLGIEGEDLRAPSDPTNKHGHMLLVHLKDPRLTVHAGEDGLRVYVNHHCLNLHDPCDPLTAKALCLAVLNNELPPEVT